MSDNLSVLLNDTLVGFLSRATDGRISFRFAEQYIGLVERPTLSQSFEDDLRRIYTGRHRELPSFFANLVPEPGPLRELLEASLQVPAEDNMALLAAVGSDLPGAVKVTPVDSIEDQSVLPSAVGVEDTHDPEQDELSGLRFSLAGVQMKFSVMRDPDRIALPAHNEHGEWIVKLGSPRFPYVVENEYAVMKWAHASGFDVPDCHLQPMHAVDAAVRQHAPLGDHVYVIRRYDRVGGNRIHQEDFAQVTGLRPQLKYDQLRYDSCAAIAMGVVGAEAYEEFIRRLVFVIASGNGDAHLKNWSLIYLDGVQPTLAPLYDQVSTIAWPEVKSELALKLAGTKNWFHVDMSSFERLANKTGGNVASMRTLVQETLERIVTGWRESEARHVMPIDHSVALRSFWTRVPLLKPLSGEMC